MKVLDTFGKYFPRFLYQSTTYSKFIEKNAVLSNNEVLYDAKQLFLQNQDLLKIENSKQKDAGMGVFAAKSIRKGTVLCFYPGVYTPSLPLHAICNFDGYQTESSAHSVMYPNCSKYTICLQQDPFTGGQIDAASLVDSDQTENYIRNMHRTEHAMSNQTASEIDKQTARQNSTQRSITPAEVQVQESRERASYCGHLINHAPKSTKPNVYHMEFSWRDLLGSDYSQFVNNREGETPDMILSKRKLPNSLLETFWFIDPLTNKMKYVPKSHTICGIVFVSLSDIAESDELYWDYGIRNGSKMYEWYNDVQYDE